VCPPTADQVNQGYLRCFIIMEDQDSVDNGAIVALDYAAAPATPAPPAGSAVGMASTPDGSGYWVAWSNGIVNPHGSAQSYGDASHLTLNQPITHIVSTPDGKGY